MSRASGTREERASEVMVGALEGVSLEGRVLAVGVSDVVVRALSASGLEVTTWDRYGSSALLGHSGRTASALPPEGPYARVCMRLPKGRDTLDAMLRLSTAQLQSGGRLWLVGANDEGIKSAPKTLKPLFGAVETVDIRRHCRLLQAEAPIDLAADGPVALSDFETPVQAEVSGRAFSFSTLPGVFAHGRLDAGTQRLLEALEVEDGARVADFGCGAGVISAWLAAGGFTGELVGIDIDTWALHCAARQPGTWVHGSGLDALDGPVDHIVSNPPFHTGKDTSFHVMDELVKTAPAHLKKNGRLTLVCPATTPIQRALEEAFSSVRKLSDDRRYRVWDAS